MLRYFYKYCFQMTNMKHDFKRMFKGPIKSMKLKIKGKNSQYS